jgi:hypothetical protein
VLFGAARVRLAPVRAPGPVRLRLEIERGDETISGQVSVEDGAPTEFYGWLQLIGHIERATDADDQQEETT